MYYAVNFDLALFAFCGLDEVSAEAEDEQH
jgi:hypothetical protein